MPLMMEKMNKAIGEYTKTVFGSGDRWLVPSPNPRALEILNQTVGGEPPSDLVVFYACCDGIAYIDDGRQETRWHIPKVENLHLLVEEARAWFRDTHPQLAQDFLPFLDLDGDYCGYMGNPHGSWKSSIHSFEHEDYEFRKDQDADDFIMDLDDDLKKYLVESGKY